MDDDTLAKGYIHAIAQRMTLDHHELLERDLVERAWPQTGGADNRPVMHGASTVGELRSLLLVVNNLPQDPVTPVTTTLQRLRAAMGAAFRCHYREQEAAYELHCVAKTDDMIDMKTREEIKRIGDAAMDLYMTARTFKPPNEFQIALVAKAWDIKPGDLKEWIAERQS